MRDRTKGYRARALSDGVEKLLKVLLLSAICVKLKLAASTLLLSIKLRDIPTARPPINRVVCCPSCLRPNQGFSIGDRSHNLLPRPAPILSNTCHCLFRKISCNSRFSAVCTRFVYYPLPTQMMWVIDK